MNFTIRKAWVGSLMAGVIGNLTILSDGAIAASQMATRAEADRAQGEMHGRVSRSVEAYAKSIGIDETYISFCRAKMDREHSHDAADGSIPFGVNYYDISSENLKLTINIRENYERSFLRLCLAEAKNTLREAARR